LRANEIDSRGLNNAEILDATMLKNSCGYVKNPHCIDAKMYKKY
jgi:hypothetical protein